jgi:hypothetical protein
LKTIGTILAGLCAALFVLTGVAALFLFNIERRAFSAQPYKRAFEKLGLYDRMPSILATSLFTSPAAVNGVENPIWALLTSPGLDSGLSTLLPPAELKLMTDGSLDSIFAYINGEADTASIPLTPIKNHLSSPAGVEAVLELLNTQPVCTAEQLFQIGLAALSGSGFLLCNPPPEALEIFKPVIQAQLQFTASILPNDITVIAGLQSGTADDPRIQLNLIRAVMRITPFFPIVFILLTTIFAVRDLKTFLNWWGYPILATGTISFLLALAGAPLIGLIIQFLIETQAAQITSEALLSALRETTSAVAREILNPILVQGLILAVPGFVMILAAFLLHRRTQLSTT